MPATRFICPDGVAILKTDCLESCRMSSRCLTKATLQALTHEERKWDGVPHVTNLLNGQMLEYLKATVDYAEDPRDSAFALLGTGHHAVIEKGAGGLGEIKLRLDWVQGTTDSIELENGEFILNDYKSYGSYRVAKVLGIVKVGPGVFVRDPKAADIHEVQLQTNCYRVMAELQLGIEVTKIRVQITVRDHGIKVAMDRGVKEQMYLVDIPLLSTLQVLGHFLPRSTSLRKVMAGDAEPQLCTPAERWDNRRCKGYCPVSHECAWGISLGAKDPVKSYYS